jgi:pimeloyl-ACP methyl ester carboxylesterase
LPRYTSTHHRSVHYKPRTAHWLFKYALEAYESEDTLREKHRGRFYRYLSGEYHNVFGVQVADTQGFVLRDQHKHSPYIIIAFRGTDVSWKMEGWRTSLIATLGTAPWLKVKHKRLKAHLGFVRAYGAVRAEVVAAVKDVKPDRIYVTGYSMGAALATLAALHIQARFPSLHVTMYSFASPCIGDHDFARVYDETVPDSHRVVHDGDLVPDLRLLFEHELPVRFECYHVGQEHLLPRHPKSRSPHHEKIYYMEQLKAEAYE